ncbi:MAG: glycoside hydrolase family 2 TIM barrel-domain containing protein [Limisphaerales bacterium]
MQRILNCITLGLICLVVPALAASAGPATDNLLSEIPAGYHLQAYDDCGVADRQPHVLMKDCYFFTFSTSDTDAGPRERSAVFSYKGIQAVYTNLDPKLSYVLALTYASDHVYKRVQSLEANGVVLHGPYPLPQAKATRVIVKVPPEVTRDGHMTLSWKIHGEVNATVSIIELWANATAKTQLEFNGVAGSASDLQGQVVDITHDGVEGAKVSLSVAGKADLATAKTGRDGLFSFDRKAVKSIGTNSELQLLVEHEGQAGRTNLHTREIFFEAIHYRPIPTKIAGVRRHWLLLDGPWLLQTNASGARGESLRDLRWKPIHVPGQFLQQGFDVPQEQPVAMAREFVAPKDWVGKRIILRFDAIHGGTRFWLNGHELGYSENLFTPVEWDITDTTGAGQTNRLDLEIKVGTVSEALSYSSAYAFHNLGGIDRSVQVFALPSTYVRQMHINAGLDKNYRAGTFQLNLGLESNVGNNNLSLKIKLQAPNGETIYISDRFIGAIRRSKTFDVTDQIANPLQWSAEKPNLYHLTLELRNDDKLLERIEREIGFRTIEIRNRQLFVNGKTVKLAGACHHEFDPLTGRANTAWHAEEDVRLLKEANLNLVRTSHYPPTTELLDAADRIGMYVECEAPFCWVGGALDTPTNLAATLTPTSAMIDYNHSHASILFWSLANESHFNLQFLRSAKMCKELDPTRPTTFNFDFANNPLCNVNTDIANWHYPPASFNVFGGDSRPVYFGEYFFPICHEQTDVRIDPGLRELWGQGQTDLQSPFAKSFLEDMNKPPIKPGLPPGGWTKIQHSDHLIGGSIWASHDEDFYLSETNHVGYAFHHGYWGLIDAWRRPKPEWWLARHIFSPVWLETRRVDLGHNEKTIRLPVENRYSFTDLNELDFTWQINSHKGHLHPNLAPGSKGELEVPIPRDANGDKLLLRITTRDRRLVEERSVQLGHENLTPLPKPTSGAPHFVEDGNKIVVQGVAFGLVFDKTKGDFNPTDSRHTAAVTSFPTPHVTRYDFGDLNGPKSPPYAVFPESNTRHFDRVDLTDESNGLRLTVHDRYKNFSGSTSWLIDKNGRGVITCDYTYSGPAMDTREAGIRIMLKPACDEIKWRRWSEWGVFPKECISRTEGTAKAHRDQKLNVAHWNQKPTWPWSLDETELGTADFRSVKLNIYQAGLTSPDGSGLTLHANADAHLRAALTSGGVAAHLLSRCRLGQVPLKTNEHLKGEFVVQLLPRR